MKKELKLSFGIWGRKIVMILLVVVEIVVIVVNIEFLLYVNFFWIRSLVGYGVFCEVFYIVSVGLVGLDLLFKFGREEGIVRKY